MAQYNSEGGAKVLDHMGKGPGSAMSETICTAPKDCPGRSVPSGEGAVMIPLAIVNS